MVARVQFTGLSAHIGFVSLRCRNGEERGWMSTKIAFDFLKGHPPTLPPETPVVVHPHDIAWQSRDLNCKNSKPILQFEVIEGTRLSVLLGIEETLGAVKKDDLTSGLLAH